MADETPFIPEMALAGAVNEGLVIRFTLMERIDVNTVVPLNLTGRSFQAQARRGKSPSSQLMFDIDIEVDGDPEDGKLVCTVSDTVTRDLEPATGFWDLLTRIGNGPIDAIFIAPVELTGGVTEWRS